MTCLVYRGDHQLVILHGAWAGAWWPGRSCWTSACRNIKYHQNIMTYYDIWYIHIYIYSQAQNPHVRIYQVVFYYHILHQSNSFLSEYEQLLEHIAPPWQTAAHEVPEPLMKEAYIMRPELSPMVGSGPSGRLSRNSGRALKIWYAHQTLAIS